MVLVDRRHFDGSAPDVVLRQRLDLSADDITVRRGVPVTSIQRTLAELAVDIEEPDYRATIDSALSLRRLSISALEHQARRMMAGRRAGSAMLNAVLTPWLLRPSMGSVAEAHVFRTLMARGIPLPDEQVPLRRVDGRGMVLDFAWPHARLALEVDGFAYHSDPTRLRSDRHRDVQLQLLGWRLVRIAAGATSAQVDSACELIGRLLQERSGSRGAD